MSDAEDLVKRFLTALEDRDIETAQACLDPTAEMIFPGHVRFTRLEQLIDWARPRYLRVGKTIERMDVSQSADGTVVTCQGTLSGAWPDGSAFDGIRFADWFLIRDGRILRQHVWNDLAEVRAGNA